jgi:hypothetical protein
MISGFTAERSQKKAGTKVGPGIELAGCPDKTVWERPGFASRTAEVAVPT